ncbi:oligopeptide/dipeptide ABC transporter ATP-binding protein [Symbiobacterium terraclitae]|uniref:Oligopeptide/dipeptide ABC transporter ATP-binding protein n=1 Tax=Symbiobacterium terraclitae TaxID=557451 RepID=A0ABS4JQI2_9FIRM|nr:oligopeptide/dipeptide ABC transporter ATP-binding protein [Symbiobacterium terraclitae]
MSVPGQAGPPLLEVVDLHKQFILPRSLLARLLTGGGNRVVHAVNGVSFVLHEGETLGLVGESGSGKSTLGRTILHLHTPTRGHVRFDGQDVFELDAAGLRRFRQQAQIVFQNPYASLNPRKTVRQILSVPLALRGLPPRERRREAAALVERVGLSARHLDQYPHQFSGGQRQRIAIARALAMHPRLIVADEPVSALDVSVQAQIINLLEDLQRELRLTYLFISHDLGVVRHLSSRVAVMYLGQIVEIGPTEPLFRDPLHPYTHALLSAAPGQGRRERIILQGVPPSPLDPPPGCPFHPRCPAAAGEVCRTVRPALTDRGGGRWVACHLTAPWAPAAGGAPRGAAQGVHPAG